MPRRDSFAADAGAGVEYSDHPLFPVEAGEVNPQVTFIQITRHDRGVQKYGPVVRAEELTTTDELFEMFGGGHYELWARGPSKMKADGPGNITRRRRMVLPGRSKPLSKDPTPEELRETEGYRPPTAETAPASASSGAGGFGGGDNTLVAIMQMQQAQSQQFMLLMVEMMKSSKGESAELAKAQAAAGRDMVTMMMTMSGQQQQSMIAMMTALMTNRGGGPEELGKYAKLLKDLGFASAGSAAKEGEGDGGEGGFGKMLEDAADFVQGIAQLKGTLPGGTLPVVPGGPQDLAANGAPAAPGSAAAVAEAMLPKAS